MMQLHEALEQIAERFGLSADNLKQHASLDNIGGWHTAPDVARWPMGSLFGVEGQVIYSLIRETKPANVMNLGTFHGASVVHMAAALKANGTPKARVYAVDLNLDAFNAANIPDDLREYIVPIEQDAIEWLNGRWPAKIGLAYEDLTHEPDQVQAVWEIFKRKANKDTLLLSHDVNHFVVGDWVKTGIQAAGVDIADGLAITVEPSDCGLFIYRQTSDN
jgi:predicted O-methyltransferase YrrM